MENVLINRDKQVIWHPYTPQKYAPDPIPIAKGDGVYLVDTDGNSYIDAISSWWVNLHGHAHPYIAEKIYGQAKTLEQVIFAGFTHEPAVQLAERLVNILPGKFSKIFYSDNGSTAVEVALKMAIQFWWNGEQMEKSGVERQEPSEVRIRESAIRGKGRPRNKILALKNSYHGDTFGAMSVSDRGIFTLAFQDKLFEVIFIDLNNFDDEIKRLTGTTTGDLPLTRQHSQPAIHLDEVACFIYEPLLQGAGSMKMYNPEFLSQVIQICRKQDIICIADEVMTGFGRTGKLFASEYLEQSPDIICLSKGLTGGTMALGVTACTDKIHNAFVSEDQLKSFFHGHSFTANPLACTAALASLDLLEEQDCLENIKKISKQNQEFVDLLRFQNALANQQNKVRNPRQLGTILAFEVETQGKDEYLNSISQVLTRKALAKGVFLRPLGNTVYIMPPYCITELQLQKVYDVLVELIEEL